MVIHDDAAATKKDIGMIMAEIGKLYDANERWKDELKTDLHHSMDVWKTELKDHFDYTVETIRIDSTKKNNELQGHFDVKYDGLKDHFDLTVENIRYDLVGANRDEIETIKDRVVRLEKHAGLGV